MLQKPKCPVIALEEHYWDKELAAQFVGGEGVRDAEMLKRLYDLGELRLREMDEAGIDMQILSHGAPSAQKLSGDDAVELTRAAVRAGAAGVLIGLEYNAITPYMGEAMTLKGFAVIILGGLGDVGGALIAGVLIGLLEALTAGYVSSVYKEAVGFLALVLTLWARPLGLFGRASVRRA